MSARSRQPHPPQPLRTQAERQRKAMASTDLKGLTPGEVEALVQELEVHKIELNLQNEQLQEAQREAEANRERFERLFDSAPAGYLTLDCADGKIVEANLTIASMLKTPRSELTGQKLSAFIAPRAQDRWHLAQRDLLEGRRRMDLSLEFVSRDGLVIDAQVVAISIDGSPDQPRWMHLSVSDVTELRRTERALQAALAAADLAEERERRKLAADLHDDAGQLLALALLKLHALSDAPETELGARTSELEKLLREVRDRISSLSFQLSPPLLHDVGLPAALRWLAEELESAHRLSTQIVEEDELELDEDVRTAFYRVIRELLINVVKHAGVGEACIRISRDVDVARIAVEDRGVGMPSRAKRYGFGLMAVRERVERLGGTLEARQTAGGRGTTVVVRLPLSQRDARGAQ